MRGLLAVCVVFVVGCGPVVEPPRCVAWQTYQMADSVSRAGSLDVCVAYD